MKKYFLVAKNTWDEILTYRLNFVVWRIRNIFQLITTYFFWSAVVPQNAQFSGYNHSLILTYILGANFLNSIVFTSRSAAVGDEINQGNLSNFLIRPLNYFLYWASKDSGDKLMNISFAVAEFALFFFIFKPNIFIQTNPLIIFLTLISLTIAITIAFLFNFLLGFIAFWSPEVWAPRFIFITIITFFSGGFFPLNILPKFWYIALLSTPLPYMQYVPMQTLLGQTPLQFIFLELFAGIIWVGLLLKIVLFIWKKGLRQYGSEGR